MGKKFSFFETKSLVWIKIFDKESVLFLVGRKAIPSDKNQRRIETKLQEASKFNLFKDLLISCQKSASDGGGVWKKSYYLLPRLLKTDSFDITLAWCIKDVKHAPHFSRTHADIGELTVSKFVGFHSVSDSG